MLRVKYTYWYCNMVLVLHAFKDKIGQNPEVFSCLTDSTEKLTSVFLIYVLNQRARI